MTTQTHDSTTCTAGVNGQKCEMCRWAAGSVQNPRPDPYSLFRASEGSQGQEIANQPVLAVVDTPDFEQEWDSAPDARRQYSYQEDAFYWFMRGVRCGELSRMKEENRVFRAMAERRGLG